MRSFGTFSGVITILLACAILLVLSLPAYSADRKIRAKVPGIT